MRTRRRAGPTSTPRQLGAGGQGGSVATALLGALLAIGCGDAGLTGPAAEDCGTGPLFTALPVQIADVEAIAVVGGLGAPGHTLPTAHTGFILATEGAAVASPGALQVVDMRRTRYVVSPNRQGEADYTANFVVCRHVSGWFGHLTSVSPALTVPESRWRDCERYSTATETVESCHARLDDVTLAPGDPLGTGGLSIALGLMGLDFGLLDTRVDNFYVARWRHPEPTFHSVCPWDRFDSTNRALLYTKLRDLARPGLVPAGEPRCGTMEVDVAGTAAGVWAEPSETQPVAGNETRYITLANYPYRPQDMLALSLGPTALGATVAVVPRETSGRVNLAFDRVTNDGQIYCYTGDPVTPGSSWLLRLTGSSALTILRVSHAAGAGPCGEDPAGWSVAGGLSLVR